MGNECRNCGGTQLQDLGSIGRVAPFFLKRVLSAELRSPRSLSPVKRFIRDFVAKPGSILSRATQQAVFVEMQLCSECDFLQTRVPFHDEDIRRLYLDYRSETYNRERTHFEPGYAQVAELVGSNDVEIENRKHALGAILQGNVKLTDSFSILDYGGSKGEFIPDLPAKKFVYDVSNAPALPGIERIYSEDELRTYSLVLLAHVTEHVPNPLGLVRKLLTWIEPNGFLYIETPQEVCDADRERLSRGGNGIEIGIHEHINSYCQKAVVRLLTAAGLDVVKAESGAMDCGWSSQVIVRALGRKRSN